MKANIREFMGDYALDLTFPHETVTLYFISHQNALNVKRIIEVDGSVPNVATVADFVEVVRCKDCIHGQWDNYYGQHRGVTCKYNSDKCMPFNHFCANGERSAKNDRQRKVN